MKQRLRPRRCRQLGPFRDPRAHVRSLLASLILGGSLLPAGAGTTDQIVNTRILVEVLNGKKR